jgi:ATP-binding cassette subfamily C protein
MFYSKIDTPKVVGKIRFIVDLLDKKSKIRLLSLTLFLSLLAILDFAAVLFIGLMTMMAMGNLESSRLPPQVKFFINHIAGTTENSQTGTLRIALIAMSLLLVRTIFSIHLTRKTFIILSAKGADLSFYLLSKLLSSPPIKLLAQNQQAIVHTLTYGVRSAVIDVIGPLMILVSDFVLLGILFCGLAFIDFWLAATSLLFFTTIAAYLYFLLHTKAGKLGKLNSELEISSNKKIFEILKNFKQIAF